MNGDCRLPLSACRDFRIGDAATSADPSERKKIYREPAALDVLHTHIDTMIETAPRITSAAIRERLTSWTSVAAAASRSPGTLAADGHQVTGVDISDIQIERARQLVPDAAFIRADATELDLPPGRHSGDPRLTAVQAR